MRLNADHLGVDDIKMTGRTEFTGLLIESVVEESVTAPNGSKTNMTVVYFKGGKKGFPCNTTNTRRIASICGGYESDKWVGKKIALWIEQGKLYGGKRGDTLRVKPQEVPR